MAEEAMRLMWMANIEALKRRLRDGEVIPYAELLHACEEPGAAGTRTEATALAEVGVVLLFCDKIIKQGSWSRPGGTYLLLVTSAIVVFLQLVNVHTMQKRCMKSLQGGGLEELLTDLAEQRAWRRSVPEPESSKAQSSVKCWFSVALPSVTMSSCSTCT